LKLIYIDGHYSALLSKTRDIFVYKSMYQNIQDYIFI